MYENEIEDLLEIRAHQTIGYESTIDTAIELMRAAAPKDEAAEREHCEEAVRAWQRGEPNCHLWGMVREQRAAVRAEMQARVDAHLEQRKQQMLEADALRAELAALKAAAQRALTSTDAENYALKNLTELVDELSQANQDISTAYAQVYDAVALLHEAEKHLTQDLKFPHRPYIVNAAALVAGAIRALEEKP